jgi:thiamine pyrophosphate-dependent acetolactate synthase large subunit-like protein
VVFHNGVYDTSGAQPLPAEGRVSFAELARSAGYADAVRFEDIESFDLALDDLLEVDGPVLVELISEPTSAGYRPPSYPTTAEPHPSGERPAPSALAEAWPRVRDSLAGPR